MESKKTNILDILFFSLIFLLFAGIAAAGWVSAQIPQALIGSGIALLILFMLVSDLKKGVRAPTHYEWFKAWMNLRPVVIGVAGFGLMALAAQFVLPATKEWPEPIKVFAVVTPMLVWAGSIAYTIWRAPHRYELDAAYKLRVGYKPPLN